MNYKNARNMTRGWCLKNSCPLPKDTGLQECADICSEYTDCRSFKHINLGSTSSCHLHNYTEEVKSVLTSRRIGNNYVYELTNQTFAYGLEQGDGVPAVGVTFCIKGNVF